MCANLMCTVTNPLQVGNVIIVHKSNHSRLKQPIRSRSLLIVVGGACVHLSCDACWDTLLASVISVIFFFTEWVRGNRLKIRYFSDDFFAKIVCLVLQYTEEIAIMVDRKRKMVFFNGSIKLKIFEAVDLRPTDFATRHQVGSQRNVQLIDPYITIDVDEVRVARTTTRQKTVKPSWSEEFTAEVHNGQMIGLTVFHDAAIPPDEFVANCTIAFDEINTKKPSNIWVSNGVFAFAK